MKIHHLLLYTILFSLFTQNVSGQTNKPCNNFDCAYKKAENFLKQDAYQKALDNLDSAEGYLTDTNTKEKEQIKQLRRRLFVAIEKEKEKAKKATVEAERQYKIAQREKQKADILLENMKKYNKRLSVYREYDKVLQAKYAESIYYLLVDLDSFKNKFDTTYNYLKKQKFESQKVYYIENEANHHLEYSNFNKAVDLLSQILDSLPDNTSALSARCYTYIVMDNLIDCIKDADKLEKLGYEAIDIHFNKGMALVYLGKYTEGSNYLTKGLQLLKENNTFEFSLYHSRIHREIIENSGMESIIIDSLEIINITRIFSHTLDILIEPQKFKSKLTTIDNIKTSLFENYYYLNWLMDFIKFQPQETTVYFMVGYYWEKSLNPKMAIKYYKKFLEINQKTPERIRLLELEQFVTKRIVGLKDD
jgi:tetratricopeptide (TPR) repeat protein